MLNNIGLYSHLAAFVAFAVLTILLLVSSKGRQFGAVLILCSALTTIWAGISALGTTMESPPVVLIQLAELLRDGGWILFLLQLMGLRFDGDTTTLGGRKWLPWFALGVVGILGSQTLLRIIPDNYPLKPELVGNITFGTWLCIAVLGLALLEQIFRNTIGAERWSIKYLCFGLGGVFAFDFFMYAEALMFRELDPNLWQARGFTTALASPLIAISIARNTDWKLQLHVSRHVVFHTVSLLGAGAYLLTMALAGYFIKFVGGSWGGVLQVSFLIAAGGLLLALFFSGKIRAFTRVFLSKHFFSYKYDYREEWLNFTEALADIGNNVPEGITSTMAGLVGSPSGLLWGLRGEKHYQLMSSWQMTEPADHSDIIQLAAWLGKTQWVIDIDELEREPDLYDDFIAAPWLKKIDDAWLVIPLMFNENLQGIMLLSHSPLQKSLNWEDRDLLKTAGRQAASYLAQFLANQDLIEARQFDAFNRLSAYVVHDLKNILAQQSLIVSNAQIHKQNPEFVDDMILTVGNSVHRMTKLMEQMRSGVRGQAPSEVNLALLLQSVADDLQGVEPKPNIEIESREFTVLADRERLQTVFAHLIQNAQEASNIQGSVTIRLSKNYDSALVEIKDNGKGMDKNFIKNRLFKPFDSTKGLTGMGIGAFESREYIRSLGGNITVESEPGTGSLFKTFIPCTYSDENSVIDAPETEKGLISEGS